MAPVVMGWRQSQRMIDRYRQVRWAPPVVVVETCANAEVVFQISKLCVFRKNVGGGQQSTQILQIVRDAERGGWHRRAPQFIWSWIDHGTILGTFQRDDLLSPRLIEVYQSIELVDYVPKPGRYVDWP